MRDMFGNDLTKTDSFGTPRTTLVMCELCGNTARHKSTKRCDRCWELERRIQYDPELARKILASTPVGQPTPQTGESTGVEGESPGLTWVGLVDGPREAKVPFNTVVEAEHFVAQLELLFPKQVRAGNFYIDGPAEDHA